MKNPLNFFFYLPYYLRKKFNEKYIIIESDDWGLERALSFDSIESLEKKYGRNKLSRWTYDSLETPEDLDELFGVLEKYKNKFEYPPVITANFITHNVDYSDKEKLSFIPISKGFNTDEKQLLKLYRTGIEKKYIFPQLHGYSHFNLSALRIYFNSAEGKEAFSRNFFTGTATVKGNLKFLHGELSKKNSESFKIKDASEVFNSFFGFRPRSIIPPTFILDHECIDILRENNISLVQSSNRLLTSMNKRLGFPYLQKRKGIYWSVRNCRLDPHSDYNFLHEQCIDSIENTFKDRLPAVIDFHRVNFAGRFAPEYRKMTIKELGLLLDKIHKKWPEVKFIHSQKLNEILWQQETK